MEAWWIVYLLTGFQQCNPIYCNSIFAICTFCIALGIHIKFSLSDLITVPLSITSSIPHQELIYISSGIYIYLYIFIKQNQPKTHSRAFDRKKIFPTHYEPSSTTGIAAVAFITAFTHHDGSKDNLRCDLFNWKSVRILRPTASSHQSRRMSSSCAIKAKIKARPEPREHSRELPFFGQIFDFMA